MVKGEGKGIVYLEKPDNWQCFFEGIEVIESSVPLDFLWILPLDGCIDHWGQSYFFSGPLTAKTRVSGDRSGFSLDLEIEANAVVKCARCLSDATLEISRNFRYFYKPLLPELSDAGDSDDGIIFLKGIEGEIDISDQVWESLILSLPEKVLCSHDCKGICPICGKDRNKDDCSCSRESVDPRFVILSELEPSENADVPGKGGNQHGNSKK